MSDYRSQGIAMLVSEPFTEPTISLWSLHPKREETTTQWVGSESS